jgi:hypothetical protein
MLSHFAVMLKFCFSATLSLSLSYQADTADFTGKQG